MRLYKAFALVGTSVLIASCASVLKYEKADQLKKNEEFDKAVEIVKPVETVTPEGEVQVTEVVPEVKPPAKTTSAKKTSTAKAKESAKTSGSATANKAAKSGTTKGGVVQTEPTLKVRQPELEDSEGFEGRRPLVDPFRVGEEVVHDVHYFKVSAGELRMKVNPFALVNNRKSYNFGIAIKTSSLFSRFYSVDDKVEIFSDYEDLVPRVFQLHVKESNQLREAKMLFDTEKNTATFWEKKVTKEHGEQEKRLEWEIPEYTQNVYSAIFYMRNFKWEVGKQYAFRVANDDENLVFSGEALRKEVLQTKLGPMKAIVIKPNIVLKGQFKPIGDNFIWLSDDDRKYVLRIESKIKIGTLVSEVVEIKPGK